MAFVSKTLAAIAFLALLPLGACASESVGVAAPQGYGAQFANARLAPASHEGLLSEPPSDARAGECYAKVVVPGQPIAAPPAQPNAVWVQTPPGMGQTSPTWCIRYMPGAPQPAALSPSRTGWIRVICDKDATEDKIRHVQQRLHDWGVYNGAYDGHFDGATAQGVARFQEQRHIDHGGYLSLQTVDALDGAPSQFAPQMASQAAFAGAYPTPPCITAPPPPQPQVVVQRVIQQVYVPSPPQVVVQKVIQPVYVPQVQQVVQRVVQPVYMQQTPVYAPQPAPCGQSACMAPPPPCGAATCGGPNRYGWGGGSNPQLGAPPYAGRTSLLYWSGKTIY